MSSYLFDFPCVDTTIPDIPLMDCIKFPFYFPGLLHTQSPKLLALEQKNEQLLRQQEVLQQRLEQQQLQQEQIMQKLAEKGLLATQRPDETTTQEMGSLLQETQSRSHQLIGILFTMLTVQMYLFWDAPHSF